MKYLLIFCVLLQISCQSSSKQVVSNAPPANTQQSNMTDVPAQSSVTTEDKRPDLGTNHSAESHYITLTGIRNVLITDGQGNDNGPISTAYKKNVPGVSETVIGPESIQIITPVHGSYVMRFTGTGSPIEIEDIRGVTNQLSDAAYIVRYADLAIQSGRIAELRIVDDRVDSLKQDVDGDGTPETVIPPGRMITDPKSADVKPPTITVNWGYPSPDRSVTITATDTGSGVKRMFYRASNASSFQEINSGSVTFTVQGGPSWSIQVVAEDNADNRSDVMTYTTQ